MRARSTGWLRSLGDDPVGAYLESAEEVVAAFAAGGVLQRPFPLPELRAEPFPAEQAISFHLIDYVVHSWDVARTLGLEVGSTTRSSPPRRRWRPTCRPVLPGWPRAPRSAPRSRM